jgi:hypothetical protein
MMVPTVVMVVNMTVTAVGAAFGLKGCLQLYEVRAEGLEHILDHMVGPNAKNLISKFSRQVPVSQVPSEADKLIGIFVPDFDNKLRGSLNLQPSPVFKLQAVSFSHRNRFWKLEKDVFTIVSRQPNAAAMARVKIEGESA